MDLKRFDPAAGGEPVRACYQSYRAGLPYDDPCGPPMPPRFFASWLELGFTEDPSEAWLAHPGAGGCPGWYVLRLPQRENRHLAMLSMVVHPDFRRAGRGAALLRHAAGRARQHGRVLLTGEAREESPGSAFARAAGARHEITEVRRLLALNEIPPGRLLSLRAGAEQAASGYELRHWAGPAPAGQRGGLARIYADAEDMPHEEDREPQHWDTERVRLQESQAAAAGLRTYTVAAMAPGRGELAGLTQLAVDPDCPAWGFQGLTAVARADRGHRLGLLMKVAMLELLAGREPQLTRIITGNADVNQYMIAVNDALGYTVLDQWPFWQLDIGAAPGARAGGLRGAGLGSGA